MRRDPVVRVAVVYGLGFIARRSLDESMERLVMRSDMQMATKTLVGWADCHAKQGVFNTKARVG